MGLIVERGFAARSGRRATGLADVLGGLQGVSATVVEDGDLEVGTWGMAAWAPGRGVLPLVRSFRRRDGDLEPGELRRLVTCQPSALTELLPAFAAAVSRPSGGLDVVTDHLGFRHVFHGRRGASGIVSTSSRACAAELGSGLGMEAVAVQSLLGWQLGQRTLFEGVHKLRPAEVVTLRNGCVEVDTTLPRAVPEAPLDLDHAVGAAAGVLRSYLAAYLEDHPEAGLQLTGGQDSRLLLSAIPKGRRKDVRVVTLGVPGDPDVDLAASLAARFGMRHELLSLSGLEDLSPRDAHELCLAAAHRVDYSADPVAQAALTWAEARSEPGPRLSGLGGEVARGFYYLGPTTDSPVTVTRARRLAQWRMFVNEAVPVDALEPAFHAWARDFAMEEVVRVLAETRQPWMAATDELYLGHRMQRWAGVTESAVCLERDVVNPMLDDRFIALARRLQPRDKRNSRFLSRLQVELDPELASLPLDGRPPPTAYARRSVRNSMCMTASTVRKGRHKAVQRILRKGRPPAGGELLAAKVAEHWREDPSTLEPLARLGLFRAEWLDAVQAGDQLPSASAVALMVNLLAATGRDQGRS